MCFILQFNTVVFSIAMETLFLSTTLKDMKTSGRFVETLFRLLLQPNTLTTDCIMTLVLNLHMW